MRFLCGVVVGILMGVLVIAPNPELDSRVRGGWDNLTRWFDRLLQP